MRGTGCRGRAASGGALRSIFPACRTRPRHRPSGHRDAVSVECATPPPRPDRSARTALGRATARFGAEERGTVVVESAVALCVVVVAFAAVMEIVSTVYESDRMARAARAVARAAAVEASLDGNAGACAAIRRELRLADDFDCDAWDISVERGVLPSELSGALDSVAPSGSGDMVLVRIVWTRDLWSIPNVVPAANAADDPPESDPEDASTDPDSGRMRLVAIGVAHGEPVG